MGKNKKATSQVEALKTSKNNSGCEKKKDNLRGLIKVLRPKVYITDSSSFKRLVQELTGNGSTTSSSSTIIPPSTTPHERGIEKSAPVIDVEEDYLGDHPESSFESSIEATADSCGLFNQESLDQEFNQLCNEIGLEGINLGSTKANQLDMDLLAYWDIESLLLDTTNPYTFYSGFDQLHQEVSIYDYELSGLL